MTHTPTQEQAEIVDAAQNTTDNLIVSALAGAAKTSTLVLLATALSKTTALCLSFNKRIAIEMQERLPSNCTAMTLNSLGHRTWADCITGRVVLKTDKNYKILSELVGKLNGDEKDRGFAEFADTLKMMESGKSAGYMPTDTFPNAKRLMNDDEFFGWLEDEPSALQERLLREATIESIAQGMKGLIDFSDQILLPTVFPSMFPHFPLVMIDEAQDLSALNHATLRKLAKKRLIAVGDSCQSIYGFRGAHEDSMNKLKDDFKMRELGLSISFRCPKSVVAAALWRAPHMKYPEWAAEGSVTELTHWNKDTIPETAAILCRNNAPLFSMAIKLLKNGRYPQLVGGDVVKYLVKIMKKFGKNDLPRAEALIKAGEWSEEKLLKTRNAAKVYDQLQCMTVFLDQGETLGDAILYAEHICNSQGPIKLSTIHKAKGLEWDNVFILDKELINLEEGQERNLMYVAITRAKMNLFYVNSKDFDDEVENG